MDQTFGGRDWKAVKSEFLQRKYKSMSMAREAVSEMLSLLGDRCVGSVLEISRYWPHSTDSACTAPLVLV